MLRLADDDDRTGLRPIPSSRDIEASVIAALISVPDAFARLSPLLDAADFFDLVNRSVWKFAVELDREGKGIDGPTLADRARDDRQVGVRLIECDEITTGSNLEHYARILRERRSERDLLSAAQTIGEAVFGKGTTDEKIETAQRAVMAIGRSARADSTLHRMTDLLPRVATVLDDRRAGRRPLGISTGFLDLDRRWKALTPGDLFLIAGRPSMGKTTLALNIAEHAALHERRRVVVFSLEMTAEQLVERSISNLAAIPLELVRDGTCLDDYVHAPRFCDAVARLKNADLLIDDGGAMTVEQIRRRVRTLSIDRPVELVVIDYLQLMDGDGYNANERVAGISRGIKQLAKELHAPILLLSQLSRRCEERNDKRPQLSDLRDSGALEQDADVVSFVYRDAVYNEQTKAPNTAEILTRKFRNGRPGRDFLRSELQFSRFQNYAGDAPDYGPPPRSAAADFDSFRG